MIDPRDVRWGETGLVPGIVQDANDGRVLMLGYLDEEALAATGRTGEVHFHSRSRGRHRSHLVVVTVRPGFHPTQIRQRRMRLLPTR